MTTTQAWREIARAYERVIATGSPAPFEQETGGTIALGAVGLCGAIDTLRRRGSITPSQFDVMLYQIIAALEEAGPLHHVYLADYDDEGAALRAILATCHAEGL